jgi:hypothetical protein
MRMQGVLQPRRGGAYASRYVVGCMLLLMKILCMHWYQGTLRQGESLNSWGAWVQKKVSAVQALVSIDARHVGCFYCVCIFAT